VTLEGCKAEFDLIGLVTWCTCLKMVTHSSTNQAQCKVTLFLRGTTVTLPLRQTTKALYRCTAYNTTRVRMTAGLDRLGASAVGHLDPLWLAELQRRYVTSGGAPPPPGHIPGVYPPNVPPDVLQRERERIGKSSTTSCKRGSESNERFPSFVYIANDTDQTFCTSQSTFTFKVHM